MDRTIRLQIQESRRLLQNPYAYLNGEGEFAALERNPDRHTHPGLKDLQNPYAFVHDKEEGHELASTKKSTGTSVIIDPATIVEERKKGARLSDEKIESMVRNLQNAMWHHRYILFSDRTIDSPLDILDPLVALASIGYQTDTTEPLGEYTSGRESFEAAGTINTGTRAVRISPRFSPTVRRFTSAHELGHALLHEGIGLHRDRPIDGTQRGATRDPVEREANVFAACFLMPAKAVRIYFGQMFLMQEFSITEATSFALNFEEDNLRKQCPTLRDLSRLLASTTFYNQNSFRSLSQQFNVSVETMAIRLEELNLVRV